MRNRFLLLIPMVTLIFHTSILAMGQPPATLTLLDLKNQIATELSHMDTDLKEAALQMSSSGLYGGTAGSLMKELYTNHNSIVDVATISLDGTLLVVEPEKYKASEGKTIADQTHFAQIKKSKKPLLSNIFKTVEGFYAVSLAYPVFSSQGDLTGFVSLVFKPDALIRNIINNYQSVQPSFEALAIQKDGEIIYDKDILQIGNMTFDNPAYKDFPSLLELANRITAEANGTGNYTFPAKLGQAAVNKSSEWTTVGLYGTEWRIILSKITN